MNPSAPWEQEGWEMPPTPAEAAAVEVYTVGRLTRHIQALLEQEFPEVWVEGEISNFKAHGNGHWYFTLKDETAQIRAVFFAGDRRRGGVELAADASLPADGMRVQVFGRITVYAPRGEYQVVVRRLKACGVGLLQQRFEALKRKLQAEGLFDAARKRPLPRLPQYVGIVTSPSGAALRDILNVLGRRFPNLHLTVLGVRVQGEGAAADIAAAIDAANAMRRRGERRFDVLIVGRGGGSIEDLWAFNEEIVARAVARSEIPIISAVGHEVDFTICDFVADVRAPTPSAAAEMLVGRRDEFDEALRRQRKTLQLLMENRRQAVRRALAELRGRLLSRRPDRMVEMLRHRCDAVRRDLLRAMERTALERRQQLDEVTVGLRRAWEGRRESLRAELKRLGAQLAVLGPEATLRRGYTLTLRENGRLLRSPDEVRPNERLTTRLASGCVESVVIGPTTIGARGSRARVPAAEAETRQMYLGWGERHESEG